MDDIVIRLNPFEISGRPEGADEYYSFEKDGERIVGGDYSNWFSLPDLLLDEQDRKFLGLSFPVYEEHKATIRNFVGEINNDGCRYISSSFDSIRYQGFGSNDRVEIYWEKPTSDVICEFASLFQGSWLYIDSEDDRETIPYGFWLSLVSDIKEDHDLI